MSEQQFALICFLVLMQNIDTKAPSYIEEKHNILNSGAEAFACLDIRNQKKVVDYCRKWRIDMPQVVKDYWSAYGQNIF